MHPWESSKGAADCCRHGDYRAAVIAVSWVREPIPPFAKSESLAGAPTPAFTKGEALGDGLRAQ